MMKKTKLIEGYLEGSLNDDEKKLFEEELHSGNLLSIVKMYDEVNQSIRDNALHELRARLEKIIARRKRRSFLFMSVAAALILIVAAGIALKAVFPVTNDPSELFNKYYTPYEADILTRSEKLSTIFEEGIKEYQEADYNEALNVFSAIDDSAAADVDLLNFYRGLASVGLMEYDKAIGFFNTIPAVWENPYSVHRDWYLALSYLKTGQLKEAEAIFTELESSGEMYSRESGEILRRR